MTGDSNDLVSRLQRWLPQGWFPTQAGTRIYAILAGFASHLSAIYGWAAYLKNQTRIATSTDGFLDLSSLDFFGSALPRLPAEPDADFSTRIRHELVRDRLTRQAIDSLLVEMTGAHPIIVEASRRSDNFAWRGRYGWRTGYMNSRALFNAVFITTTHAGVFGIQTGAWRNPNAAWRVPTFVYADPSMISGTGFTNEQLLDALNRIRPAGVTFWVWIDDFASVVMADEFGNLFVTEGGAFITT